jgi:hypothetical protein
VQSLWSRYGEIRRVELSGAHAPSVIVKRVTPPAATELARDARALRSHRRKLRSYDVERAFYLDHATRCAAGCRVPRAYHAAAGPDGWLFVLEDLDCAGYRRRRVRASRADVLAGLDWLAQFHATFLGAAPTGLWRVGTYWQLQTRPDELAALPDVALRAAAPRIDARLNQARFLSLVHGDAKLANFCFAEHGPALAAVDFQYVGGGVGVKDVAYFLGSCLEPAECAAYVPGFLDEYFRQLELALRQRLPALDASLQIPCVVAEWRELFAFAWVDFQRFLGGWAPGEFASDAFSQQLQEQVLRAVAAQP